MSCGVPCVVTSAGDSEEIVGELGVPVEPGDAEGLAAGWMKILSMDRGSREALERFLGILGQDR